MESLYGAKEEFLNSLCHHVQENDLETYKTTKQDSKEVSYTNNLAKNFKEALLHNPTKNIGVPKTTSRGDGVPQLLPLPQN